MEFPRILTVNPLTGYKLKILFDNNTIKIYDCGPLLKEFPAFRILLDYSLFKTVRADIGGYGVVWSDDLDLAESELWINGVPETLSID